MKTIESYSYFFYVWVKIGKKVPHTIPRGFDHFAGPPRGLCLVVSSWEFYLYIFGVFLIYTYVCACTNLFCVFFCEQFLVFFKLSTSFPPFVPYSRKEKEKKSEHQMLVYIFLSQGKMYSLCKKIIFLVKRMLYPMVLLCSLHLLRFFWKQIGGFTLEHLSYIPSSTKPLSHTRVQYLFLSFFLCLSLHSTSLKTYLSIHQCTWLLVQLSIHLCI